MVRAQVVLLLALLAAVITAAFFVRRTYRDRLEEQAEYHEQLIDAIPLPLGLRAADGTFMRVNTSFERRNGVSRDEVDGKAVDQVIGPARARMVAEMDTRALASNEAVECELDLSDARNEQYVQFRLQALRRRDGSVLGLVGVSNDITALRIKERELQRNNERLHRLSNQMLVAQEDERRRIARDLHDQVGQILTALKLQLGSLAKRPTIDDPAAAMVTPVDLVEEALRSTRDLSASLHPHLLDDLGLERALQWLVERFIRPAIPNIELRCRLDPPRAEAGLELVAFRVVQESLTNVVRHAQATRVGVILEAGEGELAIEVMDDGVGFDLPRDGTAQAVSLGLAGMEERVSEFGGEFAMESTRGVGTRLRVSLPWKAQP
nr:histidine kinase [Ramlibacter albus]